MKHGSQRATEDSLSRARGEFDRWRSRRPVGARIPERLWRAAVEAGRECGISKTSRELCLDYYRLRKQMAATAEERRLVEDRSAAESPAGRGFLELPLWSPGRPGCVIEMEDGHGGRLRVELTDVAPAQLEALAGALWRASR